MFRKGKLETGQCREDIALHAIVAQQRVAKTSRIFCVLQAFMQTSVVVNENGSAAQKWFQRPHPPPPPASHERLKNRARDAA